MKYAESVKGCGGLGNSDLRWISDFVPGSADYLIGDYYVRGKHKDINH